MTTVGADMAEQGYSGEVDTDGSPAGGARVSAAARLQQLKQAAAQATAAANAAAAAAAASLSSPGSYGGDSGGEQRQVVVKSGPTPPSLKQRQKEQTDAYLKRMAKARALAEEAKVVPHMTGAGYTGTLTVPQVRAGHWQRCAGGRVVVVLTACVWCSCCWCCCCYCRCYRDASVALSICYRR